MEGRLIPIGKAKSTSEKGALNTCLRVYGPSGRQLNTPEKIKATPNGVTSIEVYSTNLGIYDRSEGQVNTPIKVKSTSKGAYDTSIEVLGYMTNLESR